MLATQDNSIAGIHGIAGFKISSGWEAATTKYSVGLSEHWVEVV